MSSSTKIRVGILGYGNLGKFLVDKIQNDPTAKEQFELVFVWNRSVDVLQPLDKKYHYHVITAGSNDLGNLNKVFKGKVDLICEVSHPMVTSLYGSICLEISDFFVGSPTAFANEKVEREIREKACGNKEGRGVYVPTGAFWGAQDIAKMGDLGSLTALTVSMKKHPSSLKLGDPLKQKLDQYANDPQAIGECIVYEGPVRKLCPLAPNNVNTMACAALAASNLGFDTVKALLVADKSLDAHIVGIEACGKDGFKVTTERYNPAKVGAVTGNATYNSFLSSLKAAGNRGCGFHFC